MNTLTSHKFCVSLLWWYRSVEMKARKPDESKIETGCNGFPVEVENG